MLTYGPLILVWLGALHLHKKSSLPPAAAGLTVMLGSVVVLSAAAMLNVLRPATAVLLLGFAACTVLDLRREGPPAWAGSLRAFCTGPVLLALGAGALLAVVFAVREPLFTYWDEFFITGMNAKAMFCGDLMYRVGDMAAISTEDPCALPVLSYLCQYFNTVFSEGDLYLSYAYFYFAVFAAAAEVAERSPAGRRAGPPLFLVLAVTPFLQGYHAYTLGYRYISYGYVNSLADFPLAVGMLACVVLYLAAPRTRWYYVAFFFTALLKEAGVLLAAVAVVVIALQRLRERPLGWRGWLRWAGGSMADLFAAMLGYLLWMIYLQLSGSTSPLPGFAAAAALGAAALLWYALGARRRAACRAVLRRAGETVTLWLLPVGTAAIVLGLAFLKTSGRFSFAAGRIGQAIDILRSFFDPALRNEGWQQALEAFGESFRVEHLFLPFPDWLTVVLLFVLAGGAALLCRRRDGCLLALTQVWLSLAALAYLNVTAYFVGIYMTTQNMMEYSRYFTSYLFGWVYIVFLLALVTPRRRRWGRALALASALLCVAIMADMGLDHTVLAAPDNYKDGVYEMRKQAQAASAWLNAGDRVYLVFPTLDGYTYMYGQFSLYPALAGKAKVDTGVDYGIIYCAERDPNDPYSDRYHLAAPDEFMAMLQRNFDYVYVAGDTGSYARDYGALFEGGLEIGGLYRITGGTPYPLQRMGGDADGQ